MILPIIALMASMVACALLGVYFGDCIHRENPYTLDDRISEKGLSWDKEDDTDD